MSIAKVIEVLSEGDSVESAVQAAVTDASQTIRNIKTVYVSDIQAIVEGASVVRYRAHCKVTFVVGG
jgi:hypothetical protein